VRSQEKLPPTPPPISPVPKKKMKEELQKTDNERSEKVSTTRIFCCCFVWVKTIAANKANGILEILSSAGKQSILDCCKSI